MALHPLTKLMVCLLATTALLSVGGTGSKAGPSAGRQAFPEHAGGNGTGALPPLPPAAAPLLRAVALPQVQGQESNGTGAGPLPPPAATPLPHVSVETISTLQVDPAPSLKITYEVTTTKYMKFQDSLYRMLTDKKRTVDTVPVLAPQTGPTRLPPTWVLLTIQGTTPREAVVLAVRTDNVYIVGFKNAAGVWFAFPAFKRLIKGSTPLPKGHDYRNLVGGYGNLKDLDVNRSQVLQDVRFLSTYKLPFRPDAVHNAKLGTSLARLCVVVAEAARFKTINATVAAAMDEQGGPNRITEQETKLVVLWGVTSKALLEWQKDKVWAPEDVAEVAGAGIHGAQDAINTLKTIVQPMKSKLEAEEGNVGLQD
ncbi:hypothetical protein ACQJBY_007469 [Aegilops geniculata]